MNELPGLITASDLRVNYYRERMTPIALGEYVFSPNAYDGRLVLSKSLLLERWIMGQDGLTTEMEQLARSELAEVWTRDLLQSLIKSANSDGRNPFSVSLTPQRLDDIKEGRGADILMTKNTDLGFKAFLLFDVTLQMYKRGGSGYFFLPYQEQLSVPVINVKLARHRIGDSQYRIYEYLEILRRAIREGDYDASHPLPGHLDEKEFWGSFVDNTILPGLDDCSRRIDNFNVSPGVQSELLRNLEEGKALFRYAEHAVTMSTEQFI